MGCGTSRSSDETLRNDAHVTSSTSSYRRTNHRRQNHIFKIILLGDTAVGKSSLVYQFIYNTFDEKSNHVTKAVDFSSKQIHVDGRKIHLQVWDTAGQERFHTMTRCFYRDVDACVIVYDISNATSFDKVAFWIDDLAANHSNANLPILIVGNKVDLAPSSRAISTQKAIDFCKQRNLSWMEVTAKDDAMVDAMFSEIAQMVLKTREHNPFSSANYSEDWSV